MERQKIKWQLENYINELDRLIYEPIVVRDVGRMSLDHMKAFFLLLPKLNGEEWTDSMNTAALAVGAVHAAFDAHDSIKLLDATSKEQQLTVLSGDHYSGIHYRILSSQANYGFIRSLSGTIGTINEMKTNFHGEKLSNPRIAIDLVRMVEAGCIIDFLHTFDFAHYIPLVSTALPLTKMVQGTSTFRKLDPSETIEPIALLNTELENMLVKASYLDPILLKEIRNVAMPLLGKSI